MLLFALLIAGVVGCCVFIATGHAAWGFAAQGFCSLLVVLTDQLVENQK